MATLFRVMFHCARYGRRVREQILAFGVYPDVDRKSEVCVNNNIDAATEIPKEGLLLYPDSLSPFVPLLGTQLH